MYPTPNQDDKQTRERRLSILVSAIAFIFGLAMALTPERIALAQQADDMPPSLRIPKTTLDDIESDLEEEESDLEEEGSLQAARVPIDVLIDADPGVDDAAALIWLLSQDRYPVNVLGITTVAGNTTIENATNNVLTLYDQLGLTTADIPVVQGAGGPLVQSLSSTGKLIHGPDGLWFLGFSNPHDLSGIPNDAPTFYCDTIAANPDVLVITLGPMTNIATAIGQCPATMALASYVSLGGAKFGGNTTPGAEFNYWADPEAIEIVLNAGLDLTIVPLDAFAQLTYDAKDVDKLARKGNPAIQFLVPALELYRSIQEDESGAASLPDPAALIYALDASLGKATPALVKIIPGLVSGPDVPEVMQLVRGQTIVGINFGEKITMIADDAELSDLADRAFSGEPGFDLQFELFLILLREPDNATFVTGIDERRMWKLFDKGVFGNGVNAADAAGSVESQSSDDAQATSSETESKVYIPTIQVE